MKKYVFIGIGAIAFIGLLVLASYTNRVQNDKKALSRCKGYAAAGLMTDYKNCLEAYDFKGDMSDLNKTAREWI
mgnify:CR=1 FL=1